MSYTAAISKVEKLLQNFLELQKYTLHKFGNKTANINTNIYSYVTDQKQQKSLKTDKVENFSLACFLQNILAIKIQ